MTPELHRSLAANAVPASGLDVTVEANPAECTALAKRLRVPAVRSLRCRFRLSPKLAGNIAAAGLLDAEVIQTCVVTMEDFTSMVGEEFSVVFVPAGSESEETDPEAVDEIPYEGGTLDLGEAAAEQLALALDPYPRKPGADLPDLPQESAPHPLTDLSRLRWKQ